MTDHAAILYSYISRLTPLDLARISEAADAVSGAQLHQGTRGQIAAQDALKDACASAMRGVIAHDVALIERITERAQGREAHLNAQARLASIQAAEEQQRRENVTSFYEDRAGRPGVATR